MKVKVKVGFPKELLEEEGMEETIRSKVVNEYLEKFEDEGGKASDVDVEVFPIEGEMYAQFFVEDGDIPSSWEFAYGTSSTSGKVAEDGGASTSAVGYTECNQNAVPLPFIVREEERAKPLSAEGKSIALIKMWLMLDEGMGHVTFHSKHGDLDLNLSEKAYLRSLMLANTEINSLLSKVKSVLSENNL